MRWGKLKLKTIALESPAENSVLVSLGKKVLAAKTVRNGKQVLLTLGKPVEIEAGESLVIAISHSS